MGNLFGIGIIAFLIAILCIKAVIKLRYRYIRQETDAEKDEGDYSDAVKLQLEEELHHAINESNHAPTSHIDGHTSTGSCQQSQSPLVTFADDIRYTDSSKATERVVFEIPIQSTKQNGEPFYHVNGETCARTSIDPETQLAFLDTRSVADEVGISGLSVVYVNPKQFQRILKRRMARQKLEEMLRSANHGRQLYARSPSSKGCMRRPRGPSGRFSTSDEIAQLENGSIKVV